MKKQLHTLILLALGLGLAGAAGQHWLLRTGFDDKGLLVLPHPALYLSLGIFLVAAVLIFLQTRSLPNLINSSTTFTASWISTAGIAVYALGLLVTSFSFWTASTALLFRLCCISGIAAAAILVFFALCRKQHLPNYNLAVAIVTLHWILRLVCRYQSWMLESQMPLYLYPLLLHVLMMAGSLYRAIPEQKTPHLRKYICFCLLSIVLSCMAFPQSQDSLLYICIPLYLSAELYTLHLQKRKRREFGV